MLVHASPYEEDVMETICSLNFSKRARAVDFYKELPEVLALNFLFWTFFRQITTFITVYVLGCKVAEGEEDC